MSAQRLIVLLLAVVVAGGTGWYVMRTVDAERRAAARPAPAPQLKEVLVAATEVPVGTFVSAEMLRWQAWPNVETPATYLVNGKASVDDLVGAVARRTLVAGEPVAVDQVVKPGERGFLAAVLAPGLRAVTVPVDDASGNAGLIFPGDRVDLLLSQTVPAADETAPPRRVSETILEDVRVLAMGRRIQPSSETDATGGALDAPTPIRTVTLEVTPAGAEKVALVTDLGRLSLSLRALARDGSVAPPHDLTSARRLTWDSDVTRALEANADPVALTILRGAESEPVKVEAKSIP